VPQNAAQFNQALAGFQSSVQGGGGKPRQRNPVMTLLIPYGLMVGGNIVGAILSHIIGILGLVGSLVSLVGTVLYFLVCYQMWNELKNTTKNPQFAIWPIIVPVWGALYVNQEMARAKQMMGLPPPKSPILYIILEPWALAADMNEIAARLPPG
jgi:hypothetical protein